MTETRDTVDARLIELAALLEGNDDERALLDERMRRNGIYVARGVVHVDAEPEVRAELDRAARWEQIGGHEHIARRRGGRYQGPEATLEERDQAYAEFVAERERSA